ncbi:MAG: Holliday junction branch migration protein RuvA [Spirochaetales bacterium]|nr:Holliday junction branch migration protein RuvA [Spirochaetales bacterium]
MFNSLTGRLTFKAQDSIGLENPPGLEWEVFVSGSTLARLPGLGETVQVFTYLHHREDSMRLYGFFDPPERRIFLELLKVDGLGVKQSLKILSGITPEGFIRCLDQGDPEALTRLPGLGLKTAQKILLSLRGKLRLEDEKDLRGGGDLADSLVNMGFERRRVREALSRILGEAPGLGEEEIFRRALIKLSKG